MSEGERINQRKNFTVYKNYLNIADTTKSKSFTSYELYNALKEGESNKGCDTCSGGLAPPEVRISLTSKLSSTITIILQYCASSNLGPTQSSRITYLWFFSVASAYQWVQSVRRINGIKDNWDWDIQYPLDSDQKISIWMYLALEVIMANFPVSFSINWNDVMLTYTLTSQQLSDLIDVIKSSAQFTVWSANYATWWAYREADGHISAAIPPTPSELPNGSIVLDVALSDDPASWPNPTKWTPLKIGSDVKNYYTYNWQNVLSSCLLSEFDGACFSVANAYFPSTSERESEIDDLVILTNNLTDEQKILAEFWAGGPYTASPPGMFVWLLQNYVIPKYNNAATFIFSGLDLTIHLFEVGRVVWGLKKQHMQARPIQEIRRLYRGQTLVKYDGTPILGEFWVPYQEIDFVSPPFADFPSGHSAYSRCFSDVMTRWFGANIETIPDLLVRNTSIISPILKTQFNNYGSFTIDAGASVIQPGIVPSSPITLSWTTWEDMAHSAGVSRQYGGIHANSADSASIALASYLHSVINTYFPISVSYTF